MEFIVILIFLAVGYNFFRNFMTSGTSGGSSKTKLSDIKSYLEQMQDGEFSENGEWEPKSDGPTARGRARLAQQSRGNSPWQNAGAKKPQASRAKSRTQKARKASHKNLTQHGRRGRNMDQNRHRHADWGQRGESGFLSGKGLLILLAFGFIVLYALSQITPEMLQHIGL